MRTMAATRRSSITRTLAATVIAVGVAAGASGPSAYTVITRDGHRIEAQAKPEIQGLQALMRLAPHGQLAVIQEERIDWARTEAANPPSVIAISSDTKIVEQTPSSPAPRPQELKLIGAPRKQETTGAPVVPTPEAASQEAVAALQTEHEQVTASRDQEAEKKKALESELVELKTRQVAHAGDDLSTEVRIRELEGFISESADKINKFEARLNEIRAELAKLGGSVTQGQQQEQPQQQGQQSQEQQPQ